MFGDNPIAEMAVVSQQPPSPEIPGSGPGDALPSQAVVVPDIDPPPEPNVQYTGGSRGTVYNPYAPPQASWPAPGDPRANPALSRSMRGAAVEATYRPGLTGFEIQEGGGNGAVIYDVASVQLYMRPAPLPAAQIQDIMAVH